jgi:hypothetical protein
MSTVKKDKKMNENTEIISGTVQKISTEDYDKQLNNFKSQNEIMKLGELRAQRQHEKEKISQIINKELDQDEITQQNILDFLDNFSTTKNKESKLLGLLFRVNVICKDFKKSKEIISKLNEQLSIVRRDLQLEKTTNMDLQDEIKEGIKELEDTEKEHKKLIQKSNESQQELNTKYDNILFWMKIYTYLLVYPSVFIILIFFSQIVPSYYT